MNYFFDNERGTMNKEPKCIVWFTPLLIRSLFFVLCSLSIVHCPKNYQIDTRFSGAT